VSAALPIPVIQLLQVLPVALGAPGITGVIAKVEARLQGRRGPARFALHKERVLRLVSDLCGSRFGRGVVVPAGVSASWGVPGGHRPGLAEPRERLADLLPALGKLAKQVTADAEALMGTSSFLDRCAAPARCPRTVPASTAPSARSARPLATPTTPEAPGHMMLIRCLPWRPPASTPDQTRWRGSGSASRRWTRLSV
jgi:hypothetical protein